MGTQSCTPDTLAAQFAKANPGDTFVLEDGTYADVKLTIDACGEPGNPITIQGEDRSAVMTGQSVLHVTGKHLVLEGLKFDGCVLNDSCIDLDGAEECQVVDCEFSNSGGKRAAISIQGTATRNTIERCEFAHLEQRSVQVIIKGEAAPVDNVIVENTFRDIPRIPSGNGRETIQVGQNQRDWGHVEPRTIVERNRFLRCDGEIEIISNKSSRNTYRHNLFKDCKGELVMRGGSYCYVHGNRHENCTGGIRLSGTHHTVTHNLIRNCVGGFKIPYGMTIEQGGLYQAVTECLIAHNTVIDTEKVGLNVGINRMMDRNEMGIAKHPPYKNRFVNNVFEAASGKHVVVDQAPGNEFVSNLLAGDASPGEELEGNATTEDALLDVDARPAEDSSAFDKAVWAEGLVTPYPHLGCDPDRLALCPDG